jgi:hypothetical protein
LTRIKLGACAVSLRILSSALFVSLVCPCAILLLTVDSATTPSLQ